MIEEMNGEPTSLTEQSNGDSAYFSVSEAKLTKLYLLTFGFYAVYWFYKNWKLQAPYIQKKINPPLRSIFYLFFTYSLFERISESLKTRNIDYKFNAGILATTFLALLILGNFASGFTDRPEYPAYLSILFWLGSLFLSIFPLLQVQDAVNQLKDDPLGFINAKYSWINILFMVLGGLFWVLMLVGVVAIMFGVDVNEYEDHFQGKREYPSYKLGEWCESDDGGKTCYGYTTYFQDGSLTAHGEIKEEGYRYEAIGIWFHHENYSCLKITQDSAFDLATSEELEDISPYQFCNKIISHTDDIFTYISDNGERIKMYRVSGISQKIHDSDRIIQ